MPIGTYLAFPAEWGLAGLWTGMMVAVSLHVLSFSAAVFCLRWDELAVEVRERTEREKLEAEQMVELNAA